jgi:hypothetical protein
MSEMAKMGYHMELNLQPSLGIGQKAVRLWSRYVCQWRFGRHNLSKFIVDRNLSPVHDGKNKKG